ncbi:MAG: hypothetical protein ACQXXL_08095 [Candidatus Methanosuratincola sp.]|nr:hypothetical protein [Candidatus Methanosuratincola sp.]
MKAKVTEQEARRAGRGSDFIVEKKDLLTGEVTERKLAEVKAGKAELSKLQKKNKEENKKYEVVRILFL